MYALNIDNFAMETLARDVDVVIDYKRIAKECFWDLSIDSNDIKNIIKNDDKYKKQLLFEKILINSSKLFSDIKIFDTKELGSLLQDYKVPRFNGDYIAKRVNLIEVYFFDKPLTINELKWIA